MIPAKKARLILEIDIEQKAKENLDLQEVLKERDIKLAEAQKTQVDLLRKQRELDDANSKASPVASRVAVRPVKFCQRVTATSTYAGLKRNALRASGWTGCPGGISTGISAPGLLPSASSSVRSSYCTQL